MGVSTRVARKRTVLLLGGTGRTGGRVLCQCLQRGIGVRTIVRATARLPDAAAGEPLLTAIEVDPLSLTTAELQRQLGGSDAVISCLGHGSTLRGIFGPPFDVVTGVLNIVGAITLLLLLELSTRYMSAGAPGSSHFQAVGDVLRHARDLTNHYAVIIALCAGDAMYYWVLQRARLVPRWLPVWGFIGLLLAMSASLLVFGGLIEVVTPTYLCLTSVLGLQQLAHAAWLIVRGLDAEQGLRLAVG